MSNGNTFHFRKNLLASAWIFFSMYPHDGLYAQTIHYDAQSTPLTAYAPASPFSSAFISSVDSAERLTDTLVIKKRFWRAAGELMLAQVIPWAYNYYVRDAEFAHISW